MTFPLRTAGTRVLAAVFLALLLPVYWIAFHAPAVGIYHDDGIYLVTAKALAEGKGYRIVSLPGDPPQTKYPILFPAVLSAAWRIFPAFPDNALFLKAIPLLSAILWLLLSFRLVRDETGDRDVALWVVLLSAASSWVVFFSTTFMSETLFACLASGALICFRKLEEEGSGDKVGLPLLVFTALVAASFLTRTVGAPLVAAGAVALLLRRKYVSCAAFLAGFAVLAAPWFWWQSAHGDSARAAESYYTFSNYRGWNVLFNFPVEQKIRILATNILRLLVSPVLLLNTKGGTANGILAILVSILTTFGLVRDMSRNTRLLHLFVVFYFATIILWAWPPDRFVVPMVPFLLMFAHKELSWIFGKIFSSGKLRDYALKVPVAFLAVPLIFHLYLVTKVTERNNAASFSFVHSIYGQDRWDDTMDLLDWIRGHTPREAVVMGNLDPTIHLYTGRKAVRSFADDPYLLFFTRNFEDAMGEETDLAKRIVFNRVDYVVRTPSYFYKEGPIFNRILDRFVASHPDAFRLVKEGSDPSYKVFEVDREKLQRALRVSGLSRPAARGPARNFSDRSLVTYRPTVRRPPGPPASRSSSSSLRSAAAIPTR